MSDDDDLFAVFSASATTAPAKEAGTPARASNEDMLSPETGAKTVAATAPRGAISLLTHVPLTMPPPPQPSPGGVTPPTSSQQAATSQGLSIIASNPVRSADDETNSNSLAQHATSVPPQQVLVERHSGIHVRRATPSMVQFSVWLAQYPYASFARIHNTFSGRGAAATLSPLQESCVGVLVRKTDPKPGKRSPYAVMTLWSMQGGSPTPSEELSFLLCGSAFELMYGQLTLGAVVAITNLAPLASQGGSDAPRRDGDSQMFRAGDMDHVRLLGYAADFGTCGSVSYKSGECCHNFINKRVTKFCTFHIGDLRKAARGAAPAPSNAMKRPVGVSSIHTVDRARLASDTTRAVSKQLLKTTTFLTVRGGSGLPTASPPPRVDAAGAYAGVRMGAPLPSGAVAAPPLSYPTPQSMGVSSRGRDVLEAARQQEARQEKDRLLRQALARHQQQLASKAPVPAPSLKRSRDGEAVSPTDLVSAVKNQFAPLHRNCASSFAPMHNRASQDAVVASTGATRFQHSIVTQTSDGKKRSALVAAVAKEMQRDPSLKAAGAKSATEQHQAALGKRSAATLLGAVADKLTSSNDHLLQEAEQARIITFLDQQAVKEKALEVLETVTEQKVRVTYCYQCRRGYAKLPTSCAEAHHRTERKEIVKKYVQCDHCRYKTSIAGSSPAWKILPRCPRCSNEASWSKSNAAPEVAAPREEQHPY